MAIDDKELDELMPATELNWTEDARARMLNVPFFVRKSVVRGIEQYAKDKSIEVINDDVVSRARQEREAGAIEEAQAKRQAENKEEKQAPRQYVNFSFFKLDPAFRRLPQEQIDQGKKEFMEVLEEYDNRGDVILLSYTTMGIRADAEIMFWRVSHRMENFQEMTTKMYRTGLGKYLIQTYSYFSQTKRSMYMDIFNPEHEEDRTHIIPAKPNTCSSIPSPRNGNGTCSPSLHGRASWTNIFSSATSILPSN